MSSDDQHFLDLLASIPNDVKRYSLEVADAIDRGVDHAAVAVRNTLSTFEWIPEVARPRPPPPPPRPAIQITSPRGLFCAAQTWVSKHRAVTAAFVAFVVTGGVLVYRRRRSYTRKRRAKKAPNGQRTEVVVIAGTPNASLTRSISLDLERRGFIVYVIVRTAEEEQLVKAESRMDVRSLHLDITNPFDAQDTIDNFRKLLSNPSHIASANAATSLHLAGLILIPNISHPAGPIETLSPDHISDALNTSVLLPILTLQTLLPTLRQNKSRVLLLTPNTIPALAPPFHAIETALATAHAGFASSISAELGSMGVEMCHFKLGAFIGAPSTQPRPREADIMTWPPSVRTAYARNYFALCDGLRRYTGGGSPQRELHNAVFDAVTGARGSGVWRVGQGSLLYDVIGSWVPRGIVGWMMGIRKLDVEEMEGARQAESVANLQWERIDDMA